MRAYPVPDSVPNFRLALGNTAVAPGQDKKGLERITFSDLHQRLLEEYAPPSLVVNEEYEIVHLSSKVGKYLQIAGGEPSQNLLKLVKEELRLELRSALYQAVQQQVPVEARGLKLSLNGRSETINLHVRPVLQHDTTTRGFLLVLFEPAVDKGELKEMVRTSDQPIAQQLEEELMRLKAQLRSTNEQHKFQAEELKASNEEFQAMNEELRSATEELETSKEELQSINEELRTVNQELKVKIEETSLSSNNLMNLINSADVATIFLDRGLRVNLFTPVARQIFNLIAADFGRPLNDITNKLVYTDVLLHAEDVLQSLQPVEKEVQTTSGQTYLMRIMPYRTSDDRINGVVLSFFDITERKATEQQLRQTEEKYLHQLEQKVEERTTELKSSREQYSSLVENTPDVITRWSKDLKLTFANSAFIDKTGVQLEQLYDKTFAQMGQSEDIAVPYMQSLRKAFDTGKSVEHFNAFPTPHGEAQFFSRMVPEKNDQGAVQTVLAIARDITALKNAEQELINLKDEIAQNATNKYLMLFNSIDEGFTILESIHNEEGKISDMVFREVNASFERQTGLSDVVDKKVSELLPNSTPYWLDLYNQVTETGQPTHEENYVQDVGRWYDINCLQVGGPNSPFIALMFNDITQRKRQDQHQALLSEISKDLVAPSDIAETMKRMCEKIGRYFDAKWCLFIEDGEESDRSIRYEWQANDTSSLEGMYKATEYLSVEHGKAIRAGELCIIADTRKIPGVSAVKYGALGIRSLAIVPLVIADQLNFQLMIVCDIPQQWREDEISLLQEIMSRVWMRLERAKSEERIRESEAKAHTVAQLVPVLLWQTDASGDTITLNRRWLEYTGQSLEESQGSGWTKAIHPEDQSYTAKIFATAFKTQTEVELQYRIRSQEGEYRWFMVKQVPVKDENGKVTEWFGAAFDIHERKMADENLHSMAERLQLALEAGELGSYEYDFVTGEHLTTPQYRANFGFAEDEPYTFEELQARILPLDRAAMDLELAQAIANHTISTAEYRVQLPNGKIRWIKSMGRILYDANDKPLKMAGITLDITEEKGFTEELSRQVTERTMELQRSNEDLRQFAHVASHDLKEPVRKIKTFNNRVLDEFAGQLPAQVVAYLHKIDIASNRMTSMIDGVLHYSKLSSDSQSITDVDLNEIIQQIETDLEVLIEEKGAVLTHLNLPVLKAANVLIYQLFYNLILNALKFSRAGVTPQITISWEMAKIIEKDFFKIIVADNGIGFEPEFEQLIFKTFTRLHSIDQYDGTGLGLALCKKIIEQHHGFISAIGRPGEGASFTLLFPNHNTFYEN